MNKKQIVALKKAMKTLEKCGGAVVSKEDKFGAVVIFIVYFACIVAFAAAL